MPKFLRTLSSALALGLLAACTSTPPAPSPFQNSDGKRKGSGNAELEGPVADDLIYQSRRQYQREKARGRYDRRY
ncbi:MAG: hypothetical protein QM627_02980 [Luteolibacter sp.]